ncbi:hypothetical protein H0X48_00630 [Candidatus Dependentiae bacterium]|nr:hypothetical protein [Candidatus Dependentiae bacterium]
MKKMVLILCLIPIFQAYSENEKAVYTAIAEQDISGLTAYLKNSQLTDNQHTLALSSATVQLNLAKNALEENNRRNFRSSKRYIATALLPLDCLALYKTIALHNYKSLGFGAVTLGMFFAMVKLDQLAEQEEKIFNQKLITWYTKAALIRDILQSSTSNNTLYEYNPLTNSYTYSYTIS